MVCLLVILYIELLEHLLHIFSLFYWWRLMLVWIRYTLGYPWPRTAYRLLLLEHISEQARHKHRNSEHNASDPHQSLMEHLCQQNISFRHSSIIVIVIINSDCLWVSVEVDEAHPVEGGEDAGEPAGVLLSECKWVMEEELLWLLGACILVHLKWIIHRLVKQVLWNNYVIEFKKSSSLTETYS